jgi:hypothetical protein
MGTTKQPDIVEGILQTGRLHLMSGPSGVGKTTITLQMIEAIATGEPFLGFATTKVPILYVTADRTREEHFETCKRVGVSMDDLGVRVVAVSDYATPPLLYEVLDKHAKPGYLVIIEPLPFFIVDAINRHGNINDNTQVSHFIANIKRRAVTGQYTPLGSCHAPKSKEGLNYAMMREKTAGTSAWGAYTATNIIVEMQDPNEIDSPFRTIHFLLRNAKSFTKQFQFNEQGRLVVCQAGKSNAWDSLDKEFAAWPDDSTFSYDQLGMWIELVGCSMKTAQRWLDGKMKSGEVTRIDRGIYKKNKSWRQ